MASHRTKRSRTDAGPSPARHSQHEPPATPAAVTGPQPSSAERHERPVPNSQPPKAPGNLSMPIHEALAYIDPDYKTPHDLYLVLIYAAAAHSDVAEMMDRFACPHRDRIILEREMRELPRAMGAEALFVPTWPLVPPTRPGRPHGPARPKEAVAAERSEKAARIAARKKALEDRKAGIAPRKVKVPTKDKSFTYLVRQTEEELGWTGKYHGQGPKKAWSQKKKRQHWYDKAVQAQATIAWMQEQLLENMTDRERRTRRGLMVNVSTFGTKRNALVAMKDIIHTILVDTGDIGAQLRENWLPTLWDRFRKAVGLLSPEDLTLLRTDRKCVKDLRSLVRAARAKGLTEDVVKDILGSFAPGPEAEADSTSDGEEPSTASGSSDELEVSSDEDTEGDLAGGQFLEQLRSECYDDSGAEGFEEQDSEIG